jgi:uncharacterized protein
MRPSLQTVAGFTAYVLGCVFPLHASAQNPSFDCATNFAPDEQTICRNRTLSTLDREMAILYFAVWGSLDANQRTTFRNEQRAWLKQRAVCQTNQACLSATYQSRISYLKGLQGSASTSPPPVPSSPTPSRPTPGGSADACDMFPMLCR